MAEVASALPFVTVDTQGATLLLEGLFYLVCLLAGLAETAFPEELWLKVVGALVIWAALWVTLVAVLWS